MKALWAVEPFHQDARHLQAMHRLLGKIAGKKGRIEAGFIVTHAEPSLFTAFDVPEEERFSRYPREILKRSLKDAGISLPDNRIHVVDYETFSATKAVDRLLRLAKSKGCSLVGLYTHGRTGYLRFAMGSFAETAVHRSKLDLLLMNPKAAESKALRNILYADDFSSASHRQLPKLVRICQENLARLTVFHGAEARYRWSFDEGSRDVLAYRASVGRRARAVEALCRNAGVECQVIIRTEFRPLADQALREVRRCRADLVAVAAKAGRLTALMGGSVTRNLVRKSPVPVLVLK